jgi:hypothetical protein
MRFLLPLLLLTATTAFAKPNEAKLAVKQLSTKYGVFKIGDRVRLTKRDRALKPEETGHTASVAYGPGQVGTVTGFVHRKLMGYEFDMAVVKWDAQTWFEWDIPLKRMKEGVAYSGADLNRMNNERGPPAKLAAFELAAHPETLEKTN